MPRSDPMSVQKTVDKSLRWLLMGPAFFCWFITALLLLNVVMDLIYARPVEISRAISPTIWAVIGGIFWYFKRRLDAGNAPEMTDVGAFIFALIGAGIMIGGVVVVLDDPAGFVMIGMGAIFFGAGVMIKKVFSEPMSGIHGAGFDAPEGKRWALAEEHTTGTSSRKEFVLVDEDATPSDAREAYAKKVSEAYKGVREDWASGRIQSETERDGDIWFWVAAVLGGIAAVISLFILIFDGEIFIIAVLALFVALPTVKAIMVSVHHRKFISSSLMPDPMPPVLGSTTTMTIHTGIRASQRDRATCTLTLSCVHVYEGRDSDGDSTTETETLWSTKTTAVAEPQEGIEGLVVTAPFEMPADQPSSTMTARGNGNHWRLRVHADLPGLDYRALYVLPVVSVSHEPPLHGDDYETDAERPWGT